MVEERDDGSDVEIVDPLELDADSPPPPSPEPLEPMPHSLRFVERLASVPLVKAVFGTASQYYSGAKARSSLLAAALATAENAAAAVARRCEATVSARFRPQLELLDSLSCRGLDTLEDRYPALLRQPGEIAADVTAFGRRKAAEFKQYGIEKVDKARAVLTIAAHKVTHPVQTLALACDLLSQRTDQALDTVNEYLDLWILDHSPNYNPRRNGRYMPSALRARISYAARKFRYAFTLYFSAEARFVQSIASKCYTRCFSALQAAFSTSNPPETPREHAVTAARHVLLALSLLSERPRCFYACLCATVVARFHAHAALEPPSSGSSSPSSPVPRPPSSTHNPSAESDDSFSTSSTT